MSEQQNNEIAKIARTEEMLKYTQSIFPDTELSILSTAGSTCRVFEDTQGNAYKVFNDVEEYGYTQDEVAILHILGNEGISSRLHLYVEPNDEKIQPENTLTNGFSQSRTRKFQQFDNYIPKIKGTGDYPIAVMDKVSFSEDWKETISDEVLIREMQRVAEIAEKYNLLFGDVEFVFDNETNSIKIIDTGGVSISSSALLDTQRFNGASDEEMYKANLYMDLIIKLSRHNSNYQEVKISLDKIITWQRTGDYQTIYDIVTKRQPSNFVHKAVEIIEEPIQLAQNATELSKGFWRNWIRNFIRK